MSKFTEERLKELVSRYWEIAFDEGVKNISRGDDANEVLYELYEAFEKFSEMLKLLKELPYLILSEHIYKDEFTQWEIRKNNLIKEIEGE